MDARGRVGGWRAALVAVLAGIVGPPSDAFAAGEITVDATMFATGYAQNFDSLGATNSASLPTGWKFTAAGQGAAAGWETVTNLTAVTAAASSGTPTGGGRYNWGSGTTTTDRAPGFMTSGSYASPNGILAGFVNSTTSTITGVTMAFDYERYRVNTAAASVTFLTSTDGTNWTALPAGDSGAFTTGASTYTFSGGTVVNKSGVTLSNLTIGQNGTLYLKWNFNTTGSSSQGLGLDNVAVTFTATGGGGTDLYWVGDDTVLGGPGTWAATGGTAWRTENTDGTGGAWDPALKAVFGGTTAGSVAVDGSLDANAGIQFATTGYTISGGTAITLGGVNAVANMLTTNSGVTATITTPLAGTADVSKAGDGTLVLGGANTFSGATTVSVGALRAAHASALGTTGAGTTVTNGTALELAGDVVIGAEPLSLTGTGIGAGGALRNVSGANTFGGPITLQTATRINSDAGTLTLDVASGAAIAGAQNLTVGGAGGTVIADPIATDTGTLTKDGAGTLTLAAANTFTGTTTVSAGTLALGAAGSLASTTLSVGTGATLDLTAKAAGYQIPAATTLAGTGSVTTAAGQSVVVGTGSTISPATASTAGALALTDLTLASGGTYAVTMSSVTGTAGSNWDLLNVASAAVVTADPGAPFTVTIGGSSGNPSGFSNTNSYAWDILTLASGSIGGFAADKFTVTSSLTGVNGSFAVTSDGSRLRLTYAAGTSAGPVAWSSASGSAWLTGSNWAAGTVPGSAEVAQFGTTPSGATVGINMSTAAGAWSVGAIEVTSARTNALTVNNSTGTTSGTLTLNGATVNATANVILRNAGSQLLTLTNGSTQPLGMTLGNATDNVILVDGTGGITITSAIGGAGRGLTKAGAGSGVLTLNGVNTYTGATTVSTGTLRLGATGTLASGLIQLASGAVLDVSDKGAGGLVLAGGQALGGAGTVLGNLTFGTGSQLRFSTTDTLLVGSGTVSFASGFGVADIVGLDATVPFGLYTLINETSGGVVNLAGLDNVGPAAARPLGDGKFAFFVAGSLQLQVVPEPAAIASAAAGLAALGLLLRRRLARTARRGRRTV